MGAAPAYPGAMCTLCLQWVGGGPPVGGRGGY